MPQSGLTIRLRLLLPFFIAVVMVIVLGHSIKQSLAPLGSTDFHSYWHYGHFVRQGTDPYAAYFNQLNLAIPVNYLDGERGTSLPIAKPGLANTPANTAPLVLLLSLFSWLSWEPAKALWMALNLLLTLLIPWLVGLLRPETFKPLSWQSGLIFLVFLLLQGTRIANWVGQTTLLVFALMLGSLLLAGKHRWLAGVMLGLALSKYSLAIALFLFFLIRRDWLILVVGVAIQILGLLTVALLGGHSPVVEIGYYLRMITHHSLLPGIHWGSLLPPGSPWSWVLAGIFTLAGGVYLFRQRATIRAGLQPDGNSLSWGELHLFALLTLWSLLVVYHRAYDTLTVIVFIALLLEGLSRQTLWHLSAKQRYGLYLFTAWFIGLLAIPSSLAGIVLPTAWMPGWYQLVSAITTATLSAALLLNLWLLTRIAPVPAEAQP